MMGIAPIIVYFSCKIEVNSCKFQGNPTILSPKCPSTSFSFLRVLRARMIFGALRPLCDKVLWLKTDLLWKFQQDRIILNTFRVALCTQDIQNWNRGIFCVKYYGQGGGEWCRGKKKKNEAVGNKMKKKEKEG